MALLLLAATFAPGPIMAASVNHGLRSESADEVAVVAKLCAQQNISHTTITLKLEGGSAVQARARAARYAALGNWALTHGLSALVTAHHADDQAETLLMRMNRGAGVRGLSGMRPVSAVPGCPECALVRPLLGWRRSELAAVVDAAGETAVDDPSNRDLRFERARVRARLANVSWLDSRALAASASHIAAADAALEWAAERAFAAVQCEDAKAHWAPDDVPRVVALRVLERILVYLGREIPRGSAVARWHDQLAAGHVATLAGVRGDGRKADWSFTRAAAPRSSPIP
jgi:tRNA(Ile)-lysidine synthase